MNERKHKLIECNPQWVEWGAAVVTGVRFNCPEGHQDCLHVIPFTPALDGTPLDVSPVWQRIGDTFETLTLMPSIARRPRYASRDAAIAAGCVPEFVSEMMLCAFHGFIKDGQIEFCGDSR